MRIGKTLSIIVVSLASLIVIAAAMIAIGFFVSPRRTNQQNFLPPEGQQAVAPAGNSAVVSKRIGDSSFLFRRDLSTHSDVRLTTASNGIESEASFSHNGKLVVYSFASSQDSKSAIWLIGADGSSPHVITGEKEDALHPVFSPDDTKVFYAASGITGHYSPIVRPARHDWEVFSIPVRSDPAVAAVAPNQITHASFYDLRSLDAVADAVSPGADKLLISTTGYPIGALVEEFNLGATGRDKV